MANNQTPEKRIEFSGVFCIDTFENKEKKLQEYFVCKLINPFPDDPIDLPEVKLVAKWDKRDADGKVIKADPLFAMLKRCALSALKTMPEIAFKAYAIATSNKTGDYFASLYVISPFEYMEDEKDVQVEVKGAEERALFNAIIRKKLGLNILANNTDTAA